MKTKHSLVRMALACSCALHASTSLAQVVYHEAFDHTGITQSDMTESSRIAEYPPSLKHLEFRPTKPGSVYKSAFQKLPAEARGLTDYEFEFEFRFPRSNPKSLDFKLEFKDENDKSQKSSVCTLKIASDSSGVFGVSNAQPKLPPVRTSTKETALHPLIGGYLYKAVVRVQGNYLEAFVEAMGTTVRIGAAEIPAGLPLSGFNFNGAAPFDIDDIIVRRIPALPAGEFREDNGAQVATHVAEYKLAFPAGTNTASAKVRLGNPGEMRMNLRWADGSMTPLAVNSFGTTVTVPVVKEQPAVKDGQTVLKDGKAVMETVQSTETRALPDAGLRFREVTEKPDKNAWQLSYNVRPWVEGYLEDDRIGLARNWETYEAASQRFVKFEVRRDAKGIEYWIDGRYSGRRDSAAPLEEIVFVLPPEGVVKEALSTNVERDRSYVPLEVSHIANPGVMASAKLPVGPGPTTINGVPMVVAPAGGNLDLGVVKENMGSFALECDGYLSRTAFSGMPESLMMSVPAAQYTKAYILCAVADDPTRVPVLTARLTRLLSPSAGGRGQGIADTSITLPRRAGDALPPGVTALGEVDYDGRKAPLYLVELPLDAGKIQDVIFQEKTFSLIPQPYLDFEVLGKLDYPYQQLNKEHKPDPYTKSAVHVFGVTLWKAPVELEVVQTRFGNAFFSNEQPSLDAVLRSNAKGDARLTWEVRDVDGQVVDSGEATGAFGAAGEEKKVTITPKVPGVGHYKIKFQLTDGSTKQTVLEHRSSFALVAPDTRKAGYESPYFAWWFRGAHTTERDINLVGPLLKMAGVRRSLPENEEAGKPWGITKGQLGSFAGSVPAGQEEAKRAEYIAKMDAEVKKFPSVRDSNIFHESLNGNGIYALELYDIKVPLPEDPQLLQSQKDRVAGAILAAKLYREKYPHVRNVFVNTGESLAGAGMLMRHGFPKELLDAIGEESLGQTMPPETWTAFNYWALRTLAQKMGYGDIPVEACYEWKGRNMRDLGERRTAAWRHRDALIAHAWGNRMVPVPGIIEPGNSYYNTVWGDDWMFSRSPQNYPYMNFSTVAHFTQLLDQATFSRQLPTCSLTVYALEFKRGDDRVYAVWTARGTAELSLVFGQDVNVQQSDMFGRTKDLATKDKTLTLTTSGEPVYVVAPAEVATITVGQRRYPEDQAPADAKIQVADAMDKPENWEVVNKVDERIDNPPRLDGKDYTAFRTLGKYDVRAVTDEEKGASLEVELLHEGNVVPFLPEYTFLKLKKPAPIEGTPATLGVWVRGNSGWGQLMWEFQDAEGETWLSCGTGGYGCDVYDWPKQAAVNFDGWNFVQFPITLASPVRVPGPGEVASQWRTTGGFNSRIDYPIQLTGMAVTMTRQAINITKMDPVKTVIRLKDLSAY